MNRVLRTLFFAGLILLARTAGAQLNIEITGAGANQIPIAVLQLAGEGVLPGSISDVVAKDLSNSGRFNVLYSGGVNPLPTEMSQVNFGDWKSRNADALVIGSAARLADGRYEVRFRLFDVPKQAQLDGRAFTLSAGQWRFTAHRIADFIYEKLTGDRGVFSTRVAYVVKSRGRFELKVADSDGENAQTVLGSPEPILSPAWSPDGTRIAYVSLEQKRPVVYMQTLAGGRTVVANFRGSNSAPAWSPDGKQLAVVLTLDGNSQIYLLNPDGSGRRRLMTSSGIDTEPCFAPDGQSLYFTSDRGGSPQIYRVGLGGGDAQRVTFEGSYNVTPRISPDGKTLVYIARNNGRFQLTAMDLASRQVQTLTNTQKDESPSFAPNSRVILYATDLGGRGVLARVSSDGRFSQRIPDQAADVREPAWGPFLGDQK